MFKDSSSKRLSVTDTLIGQGTVAEGKIECDAGLRIEGEYRGDIDCKGDVIIGECGVARSNIAARDITVAGKVFGDITTTGRLTVTSSGEIHGNVYAKTMIILDGAILNGQCKMERVPEKELSRKEQREAAASSAKDQQQQQQQKAKQAG